MNFIGRKLKQQRRWRSRDLIVLAILMGSTLAVSAVALVSYQVVRGLILDGLKQQALLEVQQGSSEIDQWLGFRRVEIETLANSPIVRSMDWETAKPYLEAEVDRLTDFYKMSLASPDGSYYTTLVGRANANASDRDWFIKTMAGRTWVSDPIISRTSGEIQIIVSSPIRSGPGSEIVGGLNGSIKVDRVVEVVNRLEYGAGSYAFALNSQGEAIAHPDPATISTPEQPASSFLKSADPALVAIAQHMIAQQQGIELTQLDGTWQYVAYVPLKEANWSIALVIPRQNIELQLRALNLLASVLGGLLLVALVGTWKQVQAFEQTRTRAAQEALLNRLTNCIRESLELQTIVQTTVTELAALTQLERVVFGWYDPQTQAFELVYEFPQGLAQPQTVLRSHANCNLEGCLQQGKAVQLWGVDAKASSVALDLKTDGYLALPIPAQDGRSGYLIGLHDHALSQQDQELLQAVADQLAIAIKQAYLYTQTQTQVELLNETLIKLQQTQLQLVQSEKMSSLGQLVAGIAHEINNPVNFIYGNLSHASQYTEELLELIHLYQSHYPQPVPSLQTKAEYIDLEFLIEDLPKLLTSMQVGAQRIREIVQSLRIFSRLDEAEVKDVDIHEGLDSTLMILQNRLKSRPEHPAIEVVKEYGELPLVECYAGQLNQVFMNIISNAIDALDELNLGRSLQEIQAQPSQITIQTGVAENGRVVIRIADNGGGIPIDIQPRLFDPFFTTKSVGKGTGMGLAISYQIVTEKHQGQLWCHSVPGEGTEFAIEIPVHQSKPLVLSHPG